MKKLLLCITALIIVSPFIPSRGISDLISICSDHYGNIFVLNTSTQQVQKFDNKYNFQTTVIGKTEISGMTNLTVCWCAGEIALASSDNGSSKLFEFESANSYKYLRQIAPVGSGVGQIKNPVDIAYLRSDNDYWLSVTDRVQKKVVVIDDYGKLNKEITGLSDPSATYFSTQKKLFILDRDQVKTVGANEKKVTGSFGKGLLANPRAIEASEYEDKLFILDGNAVKSFNSAGVMLKQFGAVLDAVTMTMNINSGEVVVGSNADGGSLYVFSADGIQKSIIKNVANPVKQTVLKYTVSAYTYDANGEKFRLPCPVRIENGRSLVPVRQVVEPLGGKIAWDSKTQRISITYSNPKTVVLKIGDPYAYVDGKKTLMPSSVPPRIYCSGTTMVPLKFVSDVLGARTNYYSDSKMIEVKK